jgi:small subunit ribosomal protein S6
MSLYESTFIARHDMSTQQVEGLAETVTNLITENGGEVTKTEYWGLRTLAYRIKKNRKGHYYFFNVNAPPEAIGELERNLRLNEDVLRYLTLAVDELDPNPSPMMHARSSREERGRRGGGSFRSHGESGERSKSGGAPDSADKARPGEGEAASEVGTDATDAKGTEEDDGAVPAKRSASAKDEAAPDTAAETSTDTGEEK